MPSALLRLRAKTGLERGVDQIISRRNFRLRSSTQETSVPRTLYDDQGQFSGGARYSCRPLAASSVSSSQPLPSGWSERDGMLQSGGETLSNMLSYHSTDLVGYVSKMPWEAYSQRALLTLHEEPQRPDVLNVTQPTRNSSKSIERQPVSRQNSNTESTWNTIESTFPSRETSFPADSARLKSTSTSPKPTENLTTDDFNSHEATYTTPQSKQMPFLPSHISTEDISSESLPLAAIQFQTHLKSKAPSSSLTFIHETAEHRIHKPDAGRNRRQSCGSHNRIRHKKTLPQASSASSSSSVISHTSDGSPIADFAQSLPHYITPPPLSRSLHQTVPMPHPMPDCSPSIWTYLSRSVTSGPKGVALARLEDVLSEDVPIRALLYGWDALGRLSPFWRIIRELDDSGLYKIGAVERFAIFRLMHLNLRYASEPTPERAATRPAFMNAT